MSFHVSKWCFRIALSILLIELTTQIDDTSQVINETNCSFFVTSILWQHTMPFRIHWRIHIEDKYTLKRVRGDIHKIFASKTLEQWFCQNRYWTARAWKMENNNSSYRECKSRFIENTAAVNLQFQSEIGVSSLVQHLVHTKSTSHGHACLSRYVQIAFAVERNILRLKTSACF